MSVTNNIFKIEDFSEDYIGDKIVCEYQIVSNNPLKVKAILQYESTFEKKEIEYIKDLTAKNRLVRNSNGFLGFDVGTVILNYSHAYGFDLGKKSRVTSHSVKVDKHGRYYIKKKCGDNSYRIFIDN